MTRSQFGAHTEAYWTAVSRLFAIIGTAAGVYYRRGFADQLIDY